MYFSQLKKNTKTLPLILIGLIALFSAGCSSEPRSYLYPTVGGEDIQRVCRIALKWGRRHFSILEGRVKILDANADVPEVYLKNSLPDGYYQCGRADVGRLRCAEGAKRRLDGGACGF